MTNLQPFLDPIANSPIVAEMAQRLIDQRHVAATGQWGSCALVLAAILQKRLNRPMLIITAHLDEADDAVDQLNFFHPSALTRLYPAFEVLPGESNISHELASQRLELLVDLNAASVPQFVVAPIQALMQPSPNKNLLTDLVISIKPNQTQDRDKLVKWLADHGYTRLDSVEDAGDFAVRGDIVDVWSPGGGEGGGFPTRINFFGDQVESVHHFDLESLGPTGNIDEARIIALGDRSTWSPGGVDQTTSFLSYLPSDTIVWLIEPSEVQEQAKSYFDRLSDARGIYPPSAVLKNIQNLAWAEIHQFWGGAPNPPKPSASPANPSNASTPRPKKPSTNSRTWQTQPAKPPSASSSSAIRRANARGSVICWTSSTPASAKKSKCPSASSPSASNGTNPIGEPQKNCPLPIANCQLINLNRQSAMGNWQCPCCSSATTKSSTATTRDGA
jgi:hypothetical protein